MNTWQQHGMQESMVKQNELALLTVSKIMPVHIVNWYKRVKHLSWDENYYSFQLAIDEKFPKSIKKNGGICHQDNSLHD